MWCDLLFLGCSFGVSLVVYKYKYKVLMTIVKMCTWVYDKCNQTGCKLQHVNTIRINDKNFQHYNAYIKNKKYKLKTISDEIVEFNDVVKVFDNRKSIVHCSLTNDKEDILVDLTCVFREFVYHFDKEDNIYDFIEYVVEYNKLDFGKMDKKTTYLVMYKNDDNFTEIKHKLEELEEKTFKYVLEMKNKDDLKKED